MCSMVLRLNRGEAGSTKSVLAKAGDDSLSFLGLLGMLAAIVLAVAGLSLRKRNGKHP